MRTTILAALIIAALATTTYAQPVDGAAALLRRFDAVPFPVAMVASSRANEGEMDGSRALLGHSIPSRTNERSFHAVGTGADQIVVVDGGYALLNRRS